LPVRPLLARHFVLCPLVVLPIFYYRPLECGILEWVYVVLRIASRSAGSSVNVVAVDLDWPSISARVSYSRTSV
jgi:hypothetical protein